MGCHGQLGMRCVRFRCMTLLMTCLFQFMFYFLSHITASIFLRLRIDCCYEITNGGGCLVVVHMSHKKFLFACVSTTFILPNRMSRMPQGGILP